jgi:hypothetical protein
VCSNCWRCLAVVPCSQHRLSDRPTEGFVKNRHVETRQRYVPFTRHLQTSILISQASLDIEKRLPSIPNITLQESEQSLVSHPTGLLSDDSASIRGIQSSPDSEYYRESSQSGPWVRPYLPPAQRDLSPTTYAYSARDSPGCASYGGSTRYSPASYGGSTQCSPVPTDYDTVPDHHSLGPPNTTGHGQSPRAYHQAHFMQPFSAAQACVTDSAPTKLPMSAPAISKLPKSVETDQILGIDKQTQLEGVHAAGMLHRVSIAEHYKLTRTAERTSQDLTVALGRTAFDPSKLGAIDETRAVDPWELEKKPNPVYFPEVYSGEASFAASSLPGNVTTGERPEHFRGPSDSTVDFDPTAVEQPTPEELEIWALSSPGTTTLEDIFEQESGNMAIFGKPSENSTHHTNTVEQPSKSATASQYRPSFVMLHTRPYSPGTGSDGANLSEPETPLTDRSSTVSDPLSTSHTFSSGQSSTYTADTDVDACYLDGIHDAYQTLGKGKHPVQDDLTQLQARSILIDTNNIERFRSNESKPELLFSQGTVPQSSGQTYGLIIQSNSTASPNSSSSNLVFACPDSECALVFATQGKLT